MKYFLVMALFLFCSCDVIKSPVHLQPKFKAGDCVTFVSDSFYSNCTALVSEYSYWTYLSGDEKPDLQYTVQYSCVRGIFVTNSGNVHIGESQLKRCPCTELSRCKTLYSNNTLLYDNTPEIRELLKKEGLGTVDELIERRCITWIKNGQGF